MKKKEKGILLIAAGHPMYGKMAAVLAASIKMYKGDIPIHLVYAGDALRNLKDEHLALFDTVEAAPAETHTIGTATDKWIKIKTHLYELTPFEKTLFLDVDLVWFGKQSPSDFFETMVDTPFACANRGCVDFADSTLDPKFTQWINVNDIKTTYGFTSGLFYRLHSEFLYFIKSAANKKYFKEVRKQYDLPYVEPVRFAGAYPDEVAYAIAGTITGVYPADSPYNPSYWHTMEKKTTHTHILAETYYTYSIGGNFISETAKVNYNKLATIAFNRMGLKYPYQATAQTDKRRILPERKFL